MLELRQCHCSTIEWEEVRYARRAAQTRAERAGSSRVLSHPEGKPVDVLVAIMFSFHQLIGAEE